VPARKSGFTLIEVLIAMVIFAILMLAVTQSLLPVFALTRESQVQLQANQRAQAVLEAIRSAWQDPVKYRRTCAPIALPTGVTVEVQALNDKLDPGASLPFSTNCPHATPERAPAKRVTVRVKGPRGKERVALTMDLPEP